LESKYAARTVIPPDPAMAFVDALLEDYADEWLTKPMFHYRWAFAHDVARAAAILPRWSRTDLPEARYAALGKTFAERQIGRLAVVGSNEITAPVIEESYRRLLGLLDAHSHPIALRDGPPSRCVGLRSLRPADAARRLRPHAGGDRARDRAARRRVGGRRRRSLGARAVGHGLDVAGRRPRHAARAARGGGAGLRAGPARPRRRRPTRPR